MVSWSEDGWWIEMEIVILKLKAPKKYTSVIPHFIFPCFSHLHPALSSMIKRPRAYSIILTRLTEDWPWRQSLLTCFPFSSSPSLFAPSLLFLKKFPHNHAPPKNSLAWMGLGALPKQTCATVMVLVGIVMIIRTTFPVGVAIVVLTTSSCVCIKASIFVLI